MKTVYLAPGNLDEVLESLREDPDGTMVLAGGTELLWAIRLFGNPEPPRTVVSLHNLKGQLGQIRCNGVLDLGALVSLATLAGEIPEATKIPPILAQAALSCGFPGIRRTATLGGNLAHSMVSQLFPALAALGASVHLRSSSAQRTVDLARSIGEGDYFPLCSAGELITSVSIHMDSVEARQCYIDFDSPGKFPVVVASALWQGLLRVALLADQKLSLWIADADRNESDLPDAACDFLGLTDASPLGEVDVYRQRAMVATAIRRTTGADAPTDEV